MTLCIGCKRSLISHLCFLFFSLSLFLSLSHFFLFSLHFGYFDLDRISIVANNPRMGRRRIDSHVDEFEMTSI